MKYLLLLNWPDLRVLLGFVSGCYHHCTPTVQKAWSHLAKIRVMKAGSSLCCLLCRVAALYLVERIKSEVVSMAATHFQALAVGQARQRAIRRLARNPAGSDKNMSVSRVPVCQPGHNV